jgi:hypothetical protein
MNKHEEPSTIVESLNNVHTERMEELSLREGRGVAKKVEIECTLCGGHPRRLVYLSLAGVQVVGLSINPSLRTLEVHHVRCDLEVLRTGLLPLKHLRRLGINFSIRATALYFHMVVWNFLGWYSYS